MKPKAVFAPRSAASNAACCWDLQGLSVAIAFVYVLLRSLEATRSQCCCDLYIQVSIPVFHPSITCQLHTKLLSVTIPCCCCVFLQQFSALFECHSKGAHSPYATTARSAHSAKTWCTLWLRATRSALRQAHLSHGTWRAGYAHHTSTPSIRGVS
jgi:hypothetical protein